jgi:transcriptional regulator with XRE-family HTH domain
LITRSGPANPQVATIGGRLRRLRKERNLTQAELARQIGIQQSDLSRMEKGEYRVSLDNLVKILRPRPPDRRLLRRRPSRRPPPSAPSHEDMRLPCCAS